MDATTKTPTEITVPGQGARQEGARQEGVGQHGARKRKRGAPPKNLNGARTGSRLHRMTIGDLPDQLSHAKRRVRSYRRALEDAVLTNRSEVSLSDAHRIDEAVGHELHGAVCLWILQHRFDDLSAKEIVTCSKNLADARTARNRAVDALELDRQPDIYAQYYATPVEPPPAPPARDPSQTSQDSTSTTTTPGRATS